MPISILDLMLCQWKNSSQKRVKIGELLTAGNASQREVKCATMKTIAQWQKSLIQEILETKFVAELDIPVNTVIMTMTTFAVNQLIQTMNFLLIGMFWVLEISITKCSLSVPKLLKKRAVLVTLIQLTWMLKLTLPKKQSQPTTFIIWKDILLWDNMTPVSMK